MNPQFRNRFATLASCVLLAAGPVANAQSEEQIERLNRERQDFFEEKLDMTPEESKAFWPLYDDFQNRKIRIMDEQKSTFRYSHKNMDNLSEKETEETLDKILKQKSQLCDLEQEYYGEKFPSILPPKKVLLLYKVEWEFRKHLLKEIRGKGPGDRGEKRHGDGGKGSPGGGPGLPGEGIPGPDAMEVLPGPATGGPDLSCIASDTPCQREEERGCTREEPYSLPAEQANAGCGMPLF